MSLALDGHANGTFSTAASGTVTLTTTTPGDRILIAIMAGITANANGPAVSSVTSTHLTFTRRHQVLNKITVSATTTGFTYETWEAVAAAALTSEVITVTMSAAIDDAAMIAWGISGAGTFDPNGSLPSDVLNTAGTNLAPAPPVFSTSNANDFIFVAAGFTRNNAVVGGITSSWTQLDFVNNGGGTNFAGLNIHYEIVSATQSGVTASSTVNTGVYDLQSVDAISAPVAASHKNVIVSVGQ